MWKSVIFKEWLKIKWFAIAFTILGLLTIGYIFLTIQHSFLFSGGKNVWYSSQFMGYQYFFYFKFIPVLGGIALSVSQYVPELTNKRIKLTFHLPVKENKILLMMHSFGALTLTAAYLLLFVVFTALSRVYFPSQIVFDAVVSILPWIFAGYVTYFFVALIVLEPIWMRKLLYAAVAGLFTTIYLQSPGTAAYAPANTGLFILTILLSIVVLFSAYRFRKGEM